MSWSTVVIRNRDFKLLLIETNDTYTSNNEKKLIIDKDLCEI